MAGQEALCRRCVVLRLALPRAATTLHRWQTVSGKSIEDGLARLKTAADHGRDVGGALRRVHGLSGSSGSPMCHITELLKTPFQPKALTVPL